MSNKVFLKTSCTTPGGCVGGVCEISGWCPVENDDDLPTASPVLKDTDKFTVYIKNSVAFPHFGPQYRRNNIIGQTHNMKVDIISLVRILRHTSYKR